MSFDWREYLELARELAGLRGSGYSQEAADRSAVSRAYYAAFCWARNYAEAKLGFKPQKGPDDHKRLREHLKRQRHQMLASHLNKLRGWRNECDYDDQVPQLRQRVSVSIEVADKIIQGCR
jgi:uncharacterized protein (UPF0332 family)